MQIKKISHNVKCDVNGCVNKAENGFFFNGTNSDFAMCKQCTEKLFSGLKQFVRESKK